MKMALVALFISSISAASEGYASYYTEASCKREGTSGIYTANGERFNEAALTCALRSRAWGRSYKVTNLDNQKTVMVRHNDYGPGRGPASKGVIIDLTPAAFQALGAKPKQGKIRVRVEEL